VLSVGLLPPIYRLNEALTCGSVDATV
jgi:hypothetical protein